MRILISELSANHHDTALALIAYAAALRPKAIAVAAPPLWEGLYRSLSEVDGFIPYEGRENFRRFMDRVKSFRPTHIVHVTAYGKEPLALASAYSDAAQVGVIHDLAKLRRFSWTQWRMMRYMRFFWVLRPGLYGRLPGRYRMRSGYLWTGVYPASLEAQIPAVQGAEGKVYICIPGRVEYKRRDYRMLLEVLDRLEGREQFRFILLGPAAARHSDYADFFSRIQERGWEEIFISFSDIVPFPLYHAYLRMSQAVLALIHPNRYREHRDYLDSQISGAFPIAQAHRKPLFLHRSFAGEAELEDCSYFYDTSDDLVRLLKSLAAGSLDAGHLYRGSWFSFEEGLRRFRRGLEVG